MVRVHNPTYNKDSTAAAFGEQLGDNRLGKLSLTLIAHSLESSTVGTYDNCLRQFFAYCTECYKLGCAL